MSSSKFHLNSFKFHFSPIKKIHFISPPHHQKKMNSSIEWNDAEVRQLIDERRSRNNEYHGLRNGHPKSSFLNDIAQRINNQHRTRYSGDNCYNKFLNLTRGYSVSILIEF